MTNDERSPKPPLSSNGMAANVICNQRFAAPSAPFDAARRNEILAPDAAARDDAPARRLQRGVNMLGSGFGFVHGDTAAVFAAAGVVMFSTNELPIIIL